MAKVSDIHPKLQSKFIYAPVLINGHKVLAGIDSMASSSFMSLSLQKKLGLGFKPIEGFIKLAEEGVTSKRIGKTEPVTLKFGDKEMKHRFELLEISGKDNCVIGVDLFFPGLSWTSTGCSPDS